MKDITNYINETLFETDKWTYLYSGSVDSVSFFKNGHWGGTSDISRYEDRFVIVTSSKNLNDNPNPLIKAWEKKYKNATGKVPKYWDPILCSYGDKEYAKYIQKIGKAIDNGEITLEDLRKEIQDYKKGDIGSSENIVKYIYKKFFNK